MSLPRFHTRFHGRDPQLDRLLPRLDTVGLTTLWGPGGVGKTRLATELVQRGRGRGQRVLFASVHEDQLSEGLLRGLLRDARVPNDFKPSLQPAERLGAWLDSPPPPVVFLDEAELAPDAVAETIDVLRGALKAHVLVTSRRPVGLDGEVVEAVEPLSVDDAAEVFRGSAPRGVRYDPDAVRRVSEQLEGLPLALELAAARLDVLPLDELERRLADPMPILRNPSDPGRRGALRRSIAASWETLPDWARHQLGQLAVFATHFSLEAAEAIVEPSPEALVLDGVQLLARRSLLRSLEDSRGRVRFQLGPFVRAFLAEADPLDIDTRRRHAEWFSTRGLSVLLELHHGLGDGAFLLDEDADLVLAHRRSEADPGGDPAVDSRCAAVLACTRRAISERWRVANAQAERSADGVDPVAMAKVEEARAALAAREGHLETSIEHLRSALAWADAADAALIRAQLLGSLGNRLSNQGDEEASCDAYRKSLVLAESVGNKDAIRRALVALTLAEDWQSAWRPERSLSRFEQVAPEPPVGAGIFVHVWMAQLLVALDRPGEAIHRIDRLDLERHRDRRFPIDALMVRGFSSLQLGRLDAAGSAFREAQGLGEEGGFQMEADVATLGRALLALRDGRPEAVSPLLDVALPRLHDGPPDWAEYALVGEGILAAACVLQGESEASGAALSRMRALADAGVTEPVYARCVPLIEAWVEVLAQVHSLESGEDPRAGPMRAQAQIIQDTETDYALLLKEIREQGLAAAARLEALQEAWQVFEDGTGFKPVQGEPVDLRRSKAASRILWALAQARFDSAGSAVPPEVLIGAGWPGERLVESAARNRLHVALNTLRKRGLDLLQRVEGGYRLDPDVSVRPGPRL